MPAYWGIEDADTKHKWVNHSAEELVVGDVHTNGIESVWSLLKRSIVGAYHKVSIKHLDAYLDELEHRFNNRKNQYLFRDTLLKLIAPAALPYRDLVKAA
jgi:ISXO2-like transposase domain